MRVEVQTLPSGLLLATPTLWDGEAFRPLPLPRPAAGPSPLAFLAHFLLGGMTLHDAVHASLDTAFLVANGAPTLAGFPVTFTDKIPSRSRSWRDRTWEENFNRPSEN